MTSGRPRTARARADVRRAASRLRISAAEYEAHRAARLKWCFRSRHWICLDEFGVDRSRADGLNATCTPCRRLRASRRRALSGDATDASDARLALPMPPPEAEARAS